MHIFVLCCCIQESDAGTYYTSAETTSGEVRCRIPVFALDDNSTLQLYNWTISMSSDNSTWSNSSQLLIYDPMYVTCNDEGNQTTCLPAQVNQSVDFYASCSNSSSSGGGGAAGGGSGRSSRRRRRSSSSSRRRRRRRRRGRTKSQKNCPSANMFFVF